VTANSGAAVNVDGSGGIGKLAKDVATDTGIAAARKHGVAAMGELICDAMLGPASVECNTFILMMNTGTYRPAGPLQRAADDILSELRNCPPAAGFDHV